MVIVEGIVAIFSALSVIFFLLYIVGLLRMPTGRRPKTPTYDRYGDLLTLAPNPGFEETEEETHQ